MSAIVSFIKLPTQEKWVAIDSFFWVITMRLMIWILPFHSLQKRVQKIVSNYSYSKSNSLISMKLIKIMIIVASRYVPRATCLVQAMAGYILFSKYGYTTSIKIGVLAEEGEFEAHAWLEKENCVVLGESEKDFRTILEID